MSKLQINTGEQRFPVSKHLYGIFFEDINRAGDGGLYPEMIRNRTFEDSIPPADCRTEEDGYALVSEAGWRDEFNNGEGLSRWIREQQLEKTPIPAWYGHKAGMRLERKDTLNMHRSAALSVTFEAGGRIFNVGYAGMEAKKGEDYCFYLFAKAAAPVRLKLTLEDREGTAAESEILVEGAGYLRYDALLSAEKDCREGRFCISCPEGGSVTLGFVSLMPAKTYKGHGLRTDLAKKLEALHPAFLRFPGGCIVEGFSPETAMRFRNVTGPVWERPGHQLMWHYRSTNGLGFHEYLQLCEDLDMEPLYVFNCGMTCQGRNPVFLEGESFEEMLQDTMDALEYALGPADSKWGQLRTRMGHPEPFRMNYLEIGNENSGPEYEVRYRKCYDRIREKYPHICFVANTHVENSGLPVDIVDEHFYETAEYFAENIGFYDAYDRRGPGVFLGELAVVRGWTGQLYAALGEAAFLIGAERNQDIVKLASYAPLLENVDYNAWFPNLIRFNGRESIGIPSYYVWKMFGQNRGEYVVSSRAESDRIYRPVHGAASLTGPAGIRYRGALWNGEKLEASHELAGHCEACGDGYRITGSDQVFVVFGEEEVTEGVFDMELFVEEGTSFSIGVYASRIPAGTYIPDETHPPKPWNEGNVRPFLWKIEDGCSAFVEQTYPRNRTLAAKCPAPLRQQEYNHFHYEVDGRKMRLSVNGTLVHEVQVPGFSSLASVVTDTCDEVIIKAVNFLAEPDPVEITLDCEVEEDYEVVFLTGEKDAVNSFENPECVSDRTERRSGASACFVYEAPAYSVNIIRLRKKNESSAEEGGI